MDDYKTRGKNVDSEYIKYLADKKKQKNKSSTPSITPSETVIPKPKPEVVIPADILEKKVKHKTFGVGIIKAIDGEAIDIDFEKAGIKKLGYDFCMKNNMLEFI